MRGSLSVQPPESAEQRLEPVHRGARAQPITSLANITTFDQALRAAFDLKLNVLPLGKRTESGGIDGEEMHEHIGRSHPPVR